METNLNKVRREVVRIYKSTDVRLKNIEKSCLEGCSHCCNQNIPVHVSEELPIVDYIENEFSEPEKESLRERFRSWFKFMNENTPEASVLSEADVQVFNKKLASNRIPCPFLNDNLCSIYKVRPLACRTFYVTDSPDYCEQNPCRNGEPHGYKVQTDSFNDIARSADIMQLRLLPYAVAEKLGVMGEIKKGISAEVLMSLVRKNG